MPEATEIEAIKEDILTAKPDQIKRLGILAEHYGLPTNGNTLDLEFNVRAAVRLERNGSDPRLAISEWQNTDLQAALEPNLSEFAEVRAPILFGYFVDLLEGAVIAKKLEQAIKDNKPGTEDTGVISGIQALFIDKPIQRLVSRAMASDKQAAMNLFNEFESAQLLDDNSKLVIPKHTGDGVNYYKETILQQAV